MTTVYTNIPYTFINNKMANIIVFGINDLAELAHYYLSKDSPHSVVAFTVHKEYLTKTTFKSLPVVAFETVEEHYKPSDNMFFAPMIGHKMNRLREQIYNEGKSKGYKFISYVSSKATIFDNRIGDNCFILENNTIQPFASIGNNVVLWSGNHIGHHSSIEDHVFLTSHVVVSGHCIIKKYCTIGVNATLRDGITIAEGSFIAMGACITKSTDPWGFYKGNPAVKSNRSTKDM